MQLAHVCGNCCLAKNDIVIFVTCKQDNLSYIIRQTICIRELHAGQISLKSKSCNCYVPWLCYISNVSVNERVNE